MCVLLFLLSNPWPIVCLAYILILLNLLFLDLCCMSFLASAPCSHLDTAHAACFIFFFFLVSEVSSNGQQNTEKEDKRDTSNRMRFGCFVCLACFLSLIWPFPPCSHSRSSFFYRLEKESAFCESERSCGILPQWIHDLFSVVSSRQFRSLSDSRWSTPSICGFSLQPHSHLKTISQMKKETQLPPNLHSGVEV